MLMCSKIYKFIYLEMIWYSIVNEERMSDRWRKKQRARARARKSTPKHKYIHTQHIVSQCEQPQCTRIWTFIHKKCPARAHICTQSETESQMWCTNWNLLSQIYLALARSTVQYVWIILDIIMTTSIWSDSDCFVFTFFLSPSLSLTMCVYFSIFFCSFDTSRSIPHL